jgi:salicylate hydroxylase
MKIRANGHDYLERFGADYHQVHRADLHNALAEAVLHSNASCIFLDHCFQSLTQNGDYVVANFTNGRTVTSDMVIGCDGAASQVRANVFGDEVVNYTGQVAFRALLPMDVCPTISKSIPLPCLLVAIEFRSTIRCAIALL